MWSRPEDASLEPVPPGTLVGTPPDRPRDPWRMTRRWFVGNTVIAFLGAAWTERRRSRTATPTRSRQPLFRPSPGDDGRRTPALTPFRDALPIPPVLRPDDDGRLRVTLRTATARLHSELDPTTLWTFEGTFPGPTVEVRRGQQVRLAWHNELSGPNPVAATEVLDNTGEVREWDRPGLRGAPLIAEVATLPAFAAVHLHGTLDGGGDAGWPENPVGPGRTQLGVHANDQPATALWYRDATMDISRFTAAAGLGCGLYLIRDDTDAALPGGDRELPLILCDRNLDTDDGGALTATVLHKTVVDDSFADRLYRPCTGPFTLVNGVIWPYAEVAAAAYRLRVLNAAAARTYHLDLGAASTVVLGSDAGRYPEPVPLTGPLVLGPGERADLLVDFAAVAGQRVVVTDLAPWASPTPQVLQFRVASGPRQPAPPVPAGPAPEPAATETATSERFLVLTPDGPDATRLCELEPDGDGEFSHRDERGTLHRLRRVAGAYTDPMTIRPDTGARERWTVLNLAAAGAPRTLHAGGFTFRITRRDLYDTASSPVRWVAPGRLREHERGPKDVVSVGPGELVVLEGRFAPTPGRHLLQCMGDGADRGLLRPLAITDPAVAAVAHH